MKLWIYYETDGDSGWYGVRIFSSRIKAESYNYKLNSAYGRIQEIEVD